MTRIQQQAYEAGYQQALNAGLSTDCPYVDGAEQDSWLDGYKAAERHLARIAERL